MRGGMETKFLHGRPTVGVSKIKKVSKKEKRKFLPEEKERETRKEESWGTQQSSN